MTHSHTISTLGMVNRVEFTTITIFYMGPDNPFRPEYRELSDAEKAQIDAVKDKAFELLQSFDVPCTPEKAQAMGREMALARTKLEESVMWAVKGITK